MVEALPLRVAFILMQKNEGKLLDAWIKYHGRLARFEDITILDNGSSFPQTLEVLSNAAAVGVKVSYHFPSNQDYQRKNLIIKDIIAERQAEGYDFVVPLDCDEFLAAETHSGSPSFSPADILATLSKYKGLSGFFKLKGTYYNRHGEARDFFFYNEESVFFGASKIAQLDHGYHTAQSVDSIKATPTELVVLHFQYKRPEVAKVQATEKLKPRLPDFSPQTLAAYHGAGAHMTSLFHQNSVDGGRPQIGGKHYSFPAFEAALADAGAEFPYGMFFLEDRYRLARTIVDALPQAPRVTEEGVSPTELLLIQTYVADRDCAVLYGPSALAEALQAFGVWKTVVIGLQNDAFRTWLADNANSLAVQLGRLSINQVTLGVPVDDLGYPQQPVNQRLVARYVQVALRMLAIPPDVVILNGRYRVATGLAVLSEYAGHDPRLIVMNFWSRPHYHALLRYCECIDTEGDLVVLKPAEGVDLAEVRDFMQTKMSDPR